MRPLLVGEDNPHSLNPRHALFPVPSFTAGGRLARILSMSPRAYLRTFDRVNLCSHSWDRAEAEETAESLRLDWAGKRVLVLLGAKVCRAFGVEFRPFTVSTDGYLTVAVLPHPSGRCRLWSAAGTVARAREIMSQVVGAAFANVRVEGD